MMKHSSKYYLLTGIIFSIAGVMCLLGYSVTKIYQQSKMFDDKDISYVSYEILTDNVMPVSKEEMTNIDITRPYNDSSVVVGKKYYDYNADEKERKEAIIYYENTYMQNTGTDYTSKEDFAVLAIANGVVEEISENDITGTTIKVRHENDLISVYQSVKDVKVKENDNIIVGQQLATSGTNKIGSDLGNHLHFELYENNELTNPEVFFSNKEG